MLLTVIMSSTWIIAAVVDDRGRCTVREALDAVAATDRAAHAELLALLGRVSDAGPPRDERRSRHLSEGVFELKTPRGFRLLCRKPKPRELRGIIRRAQGLRTAYVAASVAGDIVIEIGA